MTHTPTDARNRNKSAPARMRGEREEQQARLRLERLAHSDQKTQQAANGVPAAQRRPWWPLLGRSPAEA
jgi:hypothetical protein